MMKEIKKQFMTYRNGVIADTLRKAGLHYDVIFGLQLPQLSEIARSLPHTRELALRLFADRNVRESRLLSFWIYPPEELTPEAALQMAQDLKTREEVDLFTFRLLRHNPQTATTLLTHLQSTLSAPTSASTSEPNPDISTPNANSSASASESKPTPSLTPYLFTAIQRNLQ